jgi:hypothetical protein
MARRKLAEMVDMEKKYFDLVWYERTLRNTEEELDSWPSDIRKGRDAAKARIEAAYPEDVAAITDHDEFIADPFMVGLNLGKLMAVRWAMGDEENNGDS